MSKVLFLAPGMDGPAGGLYNTGWSPAVHRLVEQNRWRVVTPALLLLAAIAAQEGMEVTVVDEDFYPAPLEERFDLVCLYVVTPTAKRAYRYAERYRRQGAWVAMGGVHASSLPDEAARYADTLFFGEGEQTFRRFLREFHEGRAQSTYRQALATVRMEESPAPLYAALRPAEQRLIPMQTARGCPHRCRFCNVYGLYGDAFRQKSARQIARELETVRRLPKAKRVYVTNDNLCSNTRHAEELCALFTGSGLEWYANTDISFGEEKRLITAAYASGLRQVLIGLEGVNEAELHELDPSHFKSRHARRYAEYIERIQSQGIGVTGSFIVGREADTAESLERLADFIDKTRLYAANITMYTPYPGTPLYARMQREDKLLSVDWNDYTIFQPVVRIENLTTDELNRRYADLLEKVNTGGIRQRKLRYWLDIYKRRGRSS